MDHKYTVHIEYQASTYLEAQKLERRMSEAIYLVLEHAALSDGLKQDAHQGDKTITKGWQSDFGLPLEEPEQSVGDVLREAGVVPIDGWLGKGPSPCSG